MVGKCRRGPLWRGNVRGEQPALGVPRTISVELDRLKRLDALAEWRAISISILSAVAVISN